MEIIPETDEEEYSEGLVQEDPMNSGYENEVYPSTEEDSEEGSESYQGTDNDDDSPFHSRLVARSDDPRLMEDLAGPDVGADQLKLQYSLEEQEVLAKAVAIKLRRSARLLPAAAETRRSRSHWDHVVEEMQWMTKEFARERQWRFRQCKRFAAHASRSNLVVESRSVWKLKEEETALRKRALWITRQVMGFWKKAERVVKYKTLVQTEAKRRAAMDQRLALIVEQTEKFSQMMAENLSKDKEEDDSEKLRVAARKRARIEEEREEAEEKDKDLVHSIEAVAHEEVPSPSPQQEHRTEEAAAHRGRVRSTRAQKRRRKRRRQDDDDDDEYLSEIDVYDDERTLEEEEVLTRRDRERGVGQDDEKAELDDLALEAELPLEELLAKYGYVVPEEGDEILAEEDEVDQMEEEQVEDERDDADGAKEGEEEEEQEQERVQVGDVVEEKMIAEEGSRREVTVVGVSQKVDELEVPAARAGHEVTVLPDTVKEEVVEKPRGELFISTMSWQEGLQVEPTASLHPGPHPTEDVVGGENGAGQMTLDNRANQCNTDSVSGVQEKHVIHVIEAQVPLGDKRQVPVGEGKAPKVLTDGYKPQEPAAVKSCSTSSLGGTKVAPRESIAVGLQEPLDSSVSTKMAVAADAERNRDLGVGAAAMKQEPREVPMAELAGEGEGIKDVGIKERSGLEVEEGPRVVVEKHESAGGGLFMAEEGGKAVESPKGGQSKGPEGPETVIEAPEDPVTSGPGVKEQVDITGPGEEEMVKMEVAERDVKDADTTAGANPKIPFLLKNSLRPYQVVGMDWLVALNRKRLNGILADEMGLGKTIQIIALLAYLACEEGVWGPHLIVVPTSVMLNWEMELKKWCPAMKLLTYFGTAKERKLKRQGWSKPNAFHVCITSYTIVLQDAKMFRRKRWRYLILDEAHMIKNWRSQRWQTLLRFNAKRRLLVTGTPLQNDLMELWSLMHFLMPQVFASHQQFKDWFCNPLTGMVEGQEAVNKRLVDRLHGVLRPFLLRRLKSEVEKQMPKKHEHVVYCRLSKRQRQLYEDYMAASDTQNTLASGSFLGIINVLMQLRKVCNHPDLFEGRPIVSALDLSPLTFHLPSLVVRDLGERFQAHRDYLQQVGLSPYPLGTMSSYDVELTRSLQYPEDMMRRMADGVRLAPDLDCSGEPDQVLQPAHSSPPWSSSAAFRIAADHLQQLLVKRLAWRRSRVDLLVSLNQQRCDRHLVYGQDLLETLKVVPGVLSCLRWWQTPWEEMMVSSLAREVIQTWEQRALACEDIIQAFMFVIPRARAPPPGYFCSHPGTEMVLKAAHDAMTVQQCYSTRGQVLHMCKARQQLFFPDRRLLQYDCGKLQELSTLLSRLKQAGHRVLIFTQMAKMLDILESFLNIHAHTYLRLDGSTKPEERQIMMQKFNTDLKYFVFILSTRSGGVGINLTGADTVIFYDSDWNPAMDQQAQDRCHRIGQTREVHIYRLVSENTIEENILQKSDQKRQLDFLAIQSGGFNIDFLRKISVKDLLGAEGGGGLTQEEIKAAFASAEDEADAQAAAMVEREEAAEMEEFVKDPGPTPVEDEDADEGKGALEEEDEEGEDIENKGLKLKEEQLMEDEALAQHDKQHRLALVDKGGDEGGPLTPGPSSQPLPQAPEGLGTPGTLATDEDIMRDVVKLGEDGRLGDAVGRLESTLRPVELYAVRLLEQTQGDAGPGAVGALEDNWGQEEGLGWDPAQGLEEEDDYLDLPIVESWDMASAGAEYKRLILIMEEKQKRREAKRAAEQARRDEEDQCLVQEDPVPVVEDEGEVPVELWYDVPEDWEEMEQQPLDFSNVPRRRVTIKRRPWESWANLVASLKVVLTAPPSSKKRRLSRKSVGRGAGRRRSGRRGSLQMERSRSFSAASDDEDEETGLSGMSRDDQEGSGGAKRRKSSRVPVRSRTSSGYESEGSQSDGDMLENEEEEVNGHVKAPEELGNHVEHHLREGPSGENEKVEQGQRDQQEQREQERHWVMAPWGVLQPADGWSPFWLAGPGGYVRHPWPRTWDPLLCKAVSDHIKALRMGQAQANNSLADYDWQQVAECVSKYTSISGQHVQVLPSTCKQRYQQLLLSWTQAGSDMAASLQVLRHELVTHYNSIPSSGLNDLYTGLQQSFQGKNTLVQQELQKVVRSLNQGLHLGSLAAVKEGPATRVMMGRSGVEISEGLWEVVRASLLPS